MSPVKVVLQAVPSAVVRAVHAAEEVRAPVQQVQVARVPAPHVVPRQIDPVGLRVMALMLENDALRAELDALRTA